MRLELEEKLDSIKLSGQEEIIQVIKHFMDKYNFGYPEEKNKTSEKKPNYIFLHGSNRLRIDFLKDHVRKLELLDQMGRLAHEIGLYDESNSLNNFEFQMLVRQYNERNNELVEMDNKNKSYQFHMHGSST